MSETTREPREDANVLVLPPGTRIVTREVVTIRETGVALPAGAVGVIVKTPGESSGPYRVRFPDGSESALLQRCAEHRLDRGWPSGRAALNDLLIRLRS